MRQIAYLALKQFLAESHTLALSPDPQLKDSSHLAKRGTCLWHPGVLTGWIRPKLWIFLC